MQHTLAGLELLCTVAGGTMAVRREPLVVPVLVQAVDKMVDHKRGCAIGVLAAIYGSDNGREKEERKKKKREVVLLCRDPPESHRRRAAPLPSSPPPTTRRVCGLPANLSTSRGTPHRINASPTSFTRPLPRRPLPSSTTALPWPPPTPAFPAPPPPT